MLKETALINIQSIILRAIISASDGVTNPDALKIKYRIQRNIDQS